MNKIIKFTAVSLALLSPLMAANAPTQEPQKPRQESPQPKTDEFWKKLFSTCF